MFNQINDAFPLLMEGIVIEKTKRAAPDAAVRLLWENDGESAFAMKLLLRDLLTIPHSGYLTRQILEVQREFAKEGSPLQVFFVDERRGRFRVFEQPALNPSDGRILFCAVGHGNAPQLALRKLAFAERRWPKEMRLLDADGFTSSNSADRGFGNPTRGRKEVVRFGGTE